jgi:hypothetical protein
MGIFFRPGYVHPSLKASRNERKLTRQNKIVVATNPVAASLDPKNFVDPLLFRPERWLDNYDGGDNLEASQPFSLGARGCLGRR